MTSNKQENKPELMGTGKAAEYIGFAVVTMKLWRGQGKGPAFRKINNKCYYDKKDLDKFLKGE